MSSEREFKSFSASASLKATVDGVELEFRPCRMETLLKFQPMITVAWKSLDVILKDNEKDKGNEQETISDKDGASIQRFNISPPTPEVIKVRANLRANAIETLSSSLGSDAAVDALGSMILDSLRGCEDADYAFKKAKIDTSSPSKFFRSLTPAMTVSLLSGMWGANKGAFGPLADKAVQAAAGAASRVQARVENMQSPQSPTPDQTSTDSSDSFKMT